MTSKDCPVHFLFSPEGIFAMYQQDTMNKHFLQFHPKDSHDSQVPSVELIAQQDII